MGMPNNNPIPSMDVIVRNNRLKKNILMYVLEAGKSLKEVKPLLDQLGNISNMHDINGKMEGVHKNYKLKMKTKNTI